MSARFNFKILRNKISDSKYDELQKQKILEVFEIWQKEMVRVFNMDYNEETKESLKMVFMFYDAINLKLNDEVSFEMIEDILINFKNRIGLEF